MLSLQSLFFFDLSAITIMLVLAYLSKHLGQALKIRPYYRILYGTIALIIIASILDLISRTVNISIPAALSLGLRFTAAAAALCACLRYWNWLFAEYFKK
jgi:hypothetical protein